MGIRKKVIHTASLKLFGGCIYCNVMLKGTDSVYLSDNKIKKELTEAPLKTQVWDENTVLCVNFNNSQLSGSNFEGSYGDVSHFKIYKTLGKQPKLYKVFTSLSANVSTVEDFSVGSACPYTYYIYSVCKQKDGTETIGNVIQSAPITLNDGIVRIIGLIQDEKDFNTYYIDMNNIWNLSLNLSDTGFTNNMAKTFTDTMHQYPKEVKGNGNYRTFQINGLLGKYDCDANRYIDTYDDIIEWERFMNNNELKLAIDLRGIMTLGSIDSNSFEYEEIGSHEVSVNFSFKQLEDIEHVNIINRQLPANPLSYDILEDSAEIPLKAEPIPPEEIPPFLTVERE